MTTLNLKLNHFDVFAYIKTAKMLGTSEELAEFQARQIEHAVEVAVTTLGNTLESKELATKQDVWALKQDVTALKQELKQDMAALKFDMLKWMLGIGIASTLVICGAMFTLLKLIVH